MLSWFEDKHVYIPKRSSYAPLGNHEKVMVTHYGQIVQAVITSVWIKIIRYQTQHLSNKSWLQSFAYIRDPYCWGKKLHIFLVASLLYYRSAMVIFASFQNWFFPNFALKGYFRTVANSSKVAFKVVLPNFHCVKSG